MTERTLAILIKAVGAATATRALKGVDSAAAGIGKRAGQGIKTATSNIARLGVVAAGVAATGVIAAVKAAGDFEAQLNTINTIARETPDNLEKIGDQIRGIARATGTPLEELTQGYYDLLSAGIKAADAQNVLTAANRLAIGGLASTAETVDLLTTAINVYGGDASKAGRYTDYFAKAVERGKVTAADLAGSFAQVGPIAAASGVEIQELAAGYARLTAAGVPAAEAATQMRSALVALQKVNGPLAKLQKQTGRNYAAMASKKGLVNALEQLRKDADKAGVPLIKLMGRVEGVNFALQTTGPNFAAYNADLAAMGDSAGTAAEQMATRQQGLNYELGRLKALAKDAAITIGSKLLPKLTPLVEKAVKFLETHQSELDDFGDKLAGAFEKAGQFAEKIPWGSIASGLQTAAQWAGTLMDAFMALPNDVKTTIIALAGLNKLTGGAVSGIVGELGKGLIKGVLGINAGVVNVRGAVVNGGGVGGAAGAGVAGAAKGGIGVLGKMFLVGEAIGLIAAVNEVREGISAGLTEQSKTIDQNVTNQIHNDKIAYGDLKQSLDAVNYGINEISSNPLNVLVGGDALDQLKKTRTDLAAKLKDQEQTFLSSFHASERQEAISAASIVRSNSTQTNQLVSAIARNRPVVNVAVRVSGDTVRVTKNYQSGSTIGHPGGSHTGGQQEF